MNSQKKIKLSLVSPAKINVQLKVTGRRSDGYHDLQSLMVPVSMGDMMEFEFLDSPDWRGASDHSGVPVGEGSLIEKAFRFASKTLEYSGGLSVNLQKKIPMGAGLGGGSSNAATVMRVLEQQTGRTISEAFYPEIAYHIGADVPFFLKDGAKWVEGIGEKITLVEEFPKISVLLVNPNVPVPTQEVYANLRKERLTFDQPTVSRPRTFSSLTDLLPFVTNDLESVVLPRYPVIREIKDRISHLGGDAALMSGSGSTVFGLFSDSVKCEYVASLLLRERPDWWVCHCRAG